jgi:predicted  nucleic acid-binding Zn-ribbon protein
MSEKMGEMARDGANYRCERCRHVLPLAGGELIPACPNCGFDTFDLANPRFETKDGVLGPHEPG